MHVFVYIYTYINKCWQNTVEIVLSEISNSMKPYASVLHAYSSKSRPEISFAEPKHLDELSNRVPPTSHGLSLSLSLSLSIYIYIYIIESAPRVLVTACARWSRSAHALCATRRIVNHVQVPWE